MVESPTGEARNAVLAITTCLMNGEDEEAWSIARSDDYDRATALIILARVLKSLHTPETWRENALNIANGR